MIYRPIPTTVDAHLFSSFICHTNSVQMSYPITGQGFHNCTIAFFIWEFVHPFPELDILLYSIEIIALWAVEPSSHIQCKDLTLSCLCSSSVHSLAIMTSPAQGSRALHWVSSIRYVSKLICVVYELLLFVRGFFSLC